MHSRPEATAALADHATSRRSRQGSSAVLTSECELWTDDRRRGDVILACFATARTNSPSTNANSSRLPEPLHNTTGTHSDAVAVMRPGPRGDAGRREIEGFEIAARASANGQSDDCLPHAEILTKKRQVALCHPKLSTP